MTKARKNSTTRQELYLKGELEKPTKEQEQE